jgi:nucleotide-binding universal stress UspA family protein
MTAIANLVLGSVVTKVLHLADVPVVLVAEWKAMLY